MCLSDEQVHQVIRPLVQAALTRPTCGKHKECSIMPIEVESVQHSVNGIEPGSRARPIYRPHRTYLVTAYPCFSEVSPRE